MALPEGVEAETEHTGDYLDSGGCAEIEVVGGGFVAVGHGGVGDEDVAGAEDLGFDTDGFFGGGDVGGDEDAAVGGGVEPALAVAFTLLWGVGAVHHYLFFEGVAEELEVAVGL